MPASRCVLHVAALALSADGLVGPPASAEPPPSDEPAVGPPEPAMSEDTDGNTVDETIIQAYELAG